MIAAGGIAHLSPWILGPAKGLAEVARQGHAPAVLGRENAAGIPVASLIIQGIGGSIFSLLFLLVPDVSTSYWMLSAVTAQIVIIMYSLMFAAVIRLRYTQPGAPRPYRIPGGKPGVWLVGGVGLIGCVASFVLGFIPPSQLKTGNPALYVGLLADGRAGADGAAVRHATARSPAPRGSDAGGSRTARALLSAMRGAHHRRLRRP